MIPTAQLTAFRTEVEKLSAHPYVHLMGAGAGAGLAGYAMAPYMFHQRERDVRDQHMGAMSPEVLRQRDRRRLLQTGAALTGGAVLGGATPFALEAAGGAAARRWRAARAEATGAAREVGKAVAEGAGEAIQANREQAVEAAHEVGKAMAGGVADAMKERVGDMATELKPHAGELAQEAVHGAKRGWKNKPAAGVATAAAEEAVRPAGTGLFSRLFR